MRIWPWAKLFWNRSIFEQGQLEGDPYRRRHRGVVSCSHTNQWIASRQEPLAMVEIFQTRTWHWYLITEKMQWNNENISAIGFSFNFQVPFWCVLLLEHVCHFGRDSLGLLVGVKSMCLLRHLSSGGGGQQPSYPGRYRSADLMLSLRSCSPHTQQYLKQMLTKV